MSYDFRADYSTLAPGTRYGKSQMQTAWGHNPLVSGYRLLEDVNPIYSIIDDPVMGRCLQQFYPLNELGASYQDGLNGGQLAGYAEGTNLAMIPPTDVCNVALDVLFCPGFWFGDQSQGKVYRLANGQGGMRVMWNYKAPSTGHCHFRMYQGRGPANPLDYPSTPAPWDIAENTKYRLHFQLDPRPGGHGKIWIKRPTDPVEVLYFNEALQPNFDPNAGYVLNHSSFFGGGGSQQRAQRASHMLTGPQHVWSGTAGEVIGPLPVPGVSITVNQPTPLVVGPAVPITGSLSPASPTAKVLLCWRTTGTPKPGDLDWFTAVVSPDGATFSAPVNIDHPGTQSTMFYQLNNGAITKAWSAIPSAV